LTEHKPTKTTRTGRTYQVVRKNPNPREYRIIRRHIEAVKAGQNTSLRKSAIAEGYSEGYAGVVAKRIDGIMSSNQYIRDLMDRHGVGMESIVKDMKSLRKATKFIRKPTANGEELVEVPDNGIRQQNLEFRAKVADALPTPKLEVEKRQINITITADTLEKIRDVKGMLPE